MRPGVFGGHRRARNLGQLVARGEESILLGDNLFGVCRSKRECVTVRTHGAAQSAWWSGMAAIVSSAERANVQLRTGFPTSAGRRCGGNLTGRISPFTLPPNPCARPGQISKAAMLSQGLPGKYGWGVFGGGGVSGLRSGCGFARSFV
jgi:hypothetical protein